MSTAGRLVKFNFPLTVTEETDHFPLKSVIGVGVGLSDAHADSSTTKTKANLVFILILVVK